MSIGQYVDHILTGEPVNTPY